MAPILIAHAHAPFRGGEGAREEPGIRPKKREYKVEKIIIVEVRIRTGIGGERNCTVEKGSRTHVVDRDAFPWFDRRASRAVQKRSDETVNGTPG